MVAAYVTRGVPRYRISVSIPHATAEHLVSVLQDIDSLKGVKPSLSLAVQVALDRLLGQVEAEHGLADLFRDMSTRAAGT